MSRISTSDMREKEVINLCGGERLGYPCDFEFDPESGRITALIVPVSCGVSWLGRREEYFIPWNKVECIGEDAVLVKIPQNELLIGNGSYKGGRESKKRKQ